MAKKKNAPKPPDSEAIIQVSLELLSVGLLTLIAGVNSEMGTLTILFMVGIWLIYLINNSAVLAGLEKMMGAVQK